MIGPDINRIIGYLAEPNKCNNIDDSVNFEIKSLKMHGKMSCEVYPAVGCKGLMVGKNYVGYYHVEVGLEDLEKKLGWGVPVVSLRCEGTK